MKHSSIFSLADTVVPSDIGVDQHQKFYELGASAQGDYHVMVLYRPAFFSPLNIAYKNPIRIGKFCVAYPIVNKREVPYGHLFCVDYSRVEISQKRIVVRNLKMKGDFNVYPFEDENLNVYKDSSGNILITALEHQECPYLVLDE